MGILEILVICIVAFTTGNVDVSFNTTNVTDNVSHYYEEKNIEKVGEEKEEVIMQIPPSYYDILEENEKLGMIIMGLLKENKECFDRDI